MSLLQSIGVGVASKIKVNVTEFNDLLGADDDTVQKALESLDAHTHEVHYFADAFTLLNGSVEAGTGEITRTFYEDQIYLQINEVSGDGCGVRLNFTLPAGITGVRVHVIGRYKGSPTHWMDAFAYDHDGAENDQISSETNRFNNSDDDAHFYFNLSSEHTKADGSVQIDFTHNDTSFNNTHKFYIDHVAVLYAGEGDASKIRGVAVDDSAKADGAWLVYDETTNTLHYDITVVTAIPSDPHDGQIIVLDLAGRKNMMIYEADADKWIVMDALENIIYYVDGGSGTDSQEKGFGAGADAFATWQYAWDQLAAIGNQFTAVINISADSYAENVVAGAKHGYGSITMKGTLTEELSATLDSAVQGSGATQGSITDTGEFGAYDEKIIYSTSADESRVIDSVTANTATIIGTWTTLPTGNYKVYDWGTTIGTGSGRGILVQNGQKGVFIEDVSFVSSGLHGAENISYSQLTLTRCNFVDCACATTLYSETFVKTCCLTGASSYGVTSVSVSSLSVWRSKIADKTYGIYTISRSDCTISRGCKLDNCTEGMHVENSSTGRSSNSAAAGRGYERISNCTTGIKAETGGFVTNTANNQYSGNTADETADAQSYID